MLVKIMVVFAMAFGLIFGGASLANASQKSYPYWKEQCFDEITYWTNKKRKFVKEEVVKVDNTLDNWRLKRVKNRSDADIKIVFKTPRRIDKISKGDWIGITWYDYTSKNYASKDNAFDNAKVVTPSKGWGWETVFTHEFWHAVGVDHVSARDRISIMNPYLGNKIVYGDYPDTRDYQLLKSVDNKCSRAGYVKPEPKKYWAAPKPESSDDVLDDALGPLPFEDVVVPEYLKRK